jgi:hypothetical protein
MTDRIKGLTVALDHDYRTDDVEAIVNAIMMVKGVSKVTTSVVDMNDWTNRTRVQMELRKKIWNALEEDKKVV